MRRIAWPAVAVVLAAACLTWGGSAVAEPPPLLVPPGAHPDSIIETPPAPLLNPATAPVVSADSARAAKADQFFLTARALESIQPGSALLSYNNALQINPTYPEANYRMGLLFLGAGEVKRAAHSFENELKYHPGHLRAARELGLARSLLDQNDAAIALLDSLVKAHPDDDETWRALGFVYKQAGQFDKAEDAYRRAIRLGPKRAGEHRDLAVLLSAQGRPDQARTELKRAIAMEDSDAANWYNLGNLERREQNYEAALEAYQQAEARDSSFGLAVQGQVGVLLDLHRTYDAGKTYRRWLDRRPDDPNARVQAIKLFEQVGRKDLALEVAQDGVKDRPKSPETHLILGETMARQGAMREALVEMRKAEALLKGKPGTEQVLQAIAELRTSAPDSLRGVFEADSVAHARALRRAAKPPRAPR